MASSKKIPTKPKAPGPPWMNADVEEEFEKMSLVAPAVGIDLGTTNTCFAIYADGQPVTLKNTEGQSITPSYVAFTEENGCIVGRDAKDQAHSNPKNTFYETKRLIGRRADDESVVEAMKFLPYTVHTKDTETMRPCFKVKTAKDTDELQTLTPEDIAAHILGKVKPAVEEHLGYELTEPLQVVITVPAHYSEVQRDATKQAATIAGLECLRIINEPTAAALAYGVQTSKRKNKNDKPLNKTVMIFDLGGGTLDVTVMKIEGVNFTVKATAGLPDLGGEVFNTRIVQHCMESVKVQFGEESSELSAEATRRLRTECELAKIRLTTLLTAEIKVPGLVGGKDFALKISRATFNELCNDDFQKAIDCALLALNDSGLTPKQLHEVVLVGGSSRIPKIQELLKKELQRGKLNKTVDADEADVIPLPIGWESRGIDMNVVLKANSPIPCQETAKFTNHEANAEYIEFKIFQGQHELTSHNVHLGTVIIPSIGKPLKPAPARAHKFTATFSVDADGLNITAVFQETGETVGIDIQPNKYRLNGPDMHVRMERIEMEAKAREKLEHAKNDHEALCNESLGRIKKGKRKIDTETWNACRALIKETREWLEALAAGDADVATYAACASALKQKIDDALATVKDVDEGALENKESGSGTDSDN